MKSLPVNLATHPYEHRQWVRRVTLVSGAVVVVITLLQIAWVWSFTATVQTANLKCFFMPILPLLSCLVDAFSIRTQPLDT